MQRRVHKVQSRQGLKDTTTSAAAAVMYWSVQFPRILQIGTRRRPLLQMSRLKKYECGKSSKGANIIQEI